MGKGIGCHPGASVGAWTCSAVSWEGYFLAGVGGISVGACHAARRCTRQGGADLGSRISLGAAHVQCTFL